MSETLNVRASSLVDSLSLALEKILAPNQKSHFLLQISPNIENPCAINIMHKILKYLFVHLSQVIRTQWIIASMIRNIGHVNKYR